MSALPAPAIGKLRSELGPAGVVEDQEVVSTRTTDWTGRYSGHSPLLLRPATLTDVEALFALCREFGIAVVPQGGNTGLVGGSVPLEGEVLVSTERMNAIHDPDPAAGQLTAEAGVPIVAVQHAARQLGWDYGVDLAARDSATVGGTVATNAGGLSVLRHGDTSQQLLGAAAVFGSGTRVERLGGLVKDNTGYKLSQLLCGSEGTLGIVTAARIQLVPRHHARTTAFVAYKSSADAIRAGQSLRGNIDSLSAVELVLASGLKLVCTTYGLELPFDSLPPAALVIEAAAHSDPTSDLSAALEAGPTPEAIAVATDSARSAALWRFREAHTEAIATVGIPHKLDVTLPAESLADFVAAVPDIVATVAPDAETWCFGHVADGNVHVNITGVSPDDESVDDAVLEAVIEAGGSISAEHGIGNAKKRWFSESVAAEELSAMRAVKRALDPDGICNPNVFGL